MKKTRFPEGWDEKRVKAVLAHYENQTESEAVAEDEAAWNDRSESFVRVPSDLLPRIRALLARSRPRKRPSRTSVSKA